MAARAKGRAVKRAKGGHSARPGKASKRLGKRPSRKAATRHAGSSAKRAASNKRTTPKRKRAAAPKAVRKSANIAAPSRRVPAKTPRLDRVRRILDDTVPTPPSSLNLDRRASAARTGRAEMAESLEEHRGMSPAITAGDVDVDVEDAYFTGDEAPGGDNSTPDQDIVDDIGKALGVQYNEGEELKSTDKIIERDRHRWEMDPASSEDYKDRK
jgi:hypothetical protein